MDRPFFAFHETGETYVFNEKGKSKPVLLWYTRPGHFERLRGTPEATAALTGATAGKVTGYRAGTGSARAAQDARSVASRTVASSTVGGRTAVFDRWRAYALQRVPAAASSAPG
eukprot:14856877-Alexandrium_andersonii.AAC.1